MPNYPSPQPTPVAGPTAVQTYNLSNIPSNAYQLLSNLADDFDRLNKKLNTHADKLHTIKNSTNNTVGEVISTSKGLVTDTLTDVWHGSTTDLNTAHDQLSTITTYQGGLGYATDFRNTLDANKTTIQTGLIALEDLQNQQSGRAAPVSSEQLAQWQQDIQALDNALANINMVIDVMAMVIRKLNNGFAVTCATGFVPGGPLPNFPKNAFAMQMKAGASGSAEDNILTQIKNALKKASGNKLEDALAELKAMGLMMDAWDAGIKDPSVIANLLEKGVSADTIEASMGDISNLLDKGATNDTLTSLFQKGAKLTDVKTLLNKGVSIDVINTWAKTAGKKNLTNLISDATNNIQPLLDKGMTTDGINGLLKNGIPLKDTVRHGQEIKRANQEQRGKMV